jgi:hypothetical protein
MINAKSNYWNFYSEFLWNHYHHIYHVDIFKPSLMQFDKHIVGHVGDEFPTRQIACARYIWVHVYAYICVCIISICDSLSCNS